MNTALRELRGQRGKTQKEIADFAKISLKSYQRIEKGEQDPSVSVAKEIADALGVKSYKQFKALFGAATPDR